MTAWLFNLAYLALLAAASPWLLYQALRHGKYREGWLERFLGHVPMRDSQRRCVWLHAVSLGEVNVEVAKRLGIGRSTLYRKLKAYGIGEAQSAAARL